jgi:hypothetical protein
VTFLLFLTSLAVIQYLTRKTTTPRKEGPKLKEQPQQSVKQPQAEVDRTVAESTPGLAALAHALNRHGRGNTPTTLVSTVETSTSPVDQVK